MILGGGGGFGVFRRDLDYVGYPHPQTHTHHNHHHLTPVVYFKAEKHEFIHILLPVTIQTSSHIIV